MQVKIFSNFTLTIRAINVHAGPFYKITNKESDWAMLLEEIFRLEQCASTKFLVLNHVIEKCLKSDYGPLENMPRWPAGLMETPAASPCTAREPQLACLGIPRLNWPDILSYLPTINVGREGGIFTSWLGQLQPKSEREREAPALTLKKASTRLEQPKEPRNATRNEWPDWCKRKWEANFWWRSPVAAWQPIKGSIYWYDKDKGN